MPGHEAGPEPCPTGFFPLQPLLSSWGARAGNTSAHWPGALVCPSEGPEPLACVQAGPHGTTIV